MLLLTLLLFAAAATAQAQCTTTWNGTALAGALEDGACRFSVRYGSAQRWGYSAFASSQADINAADYPPICPQPGWEQSVIPLPKQRLIEDCLMAVVWAPAGANASSALPVFVWLHGGSFVAGSASDSGLNGAPLAAEGVLTVFVQYRLGALGLLPPPEAASSADPNLAVLDVILALRVVRDNIAAVGGDPRRVTLGGQSAGASMNYGAQSRQNQLDLQDYFYRNANTSLFPHCADMACYNNISLPTLLAWQSYVNNTAPFLLSGVAFGEVYRPQYGTQTIPHDPTNALWAGNLSRLAINTSIPVLATTLKNEAGYLVGVLLPVPIPASSQLANFTLRKLMGQERANTVLESGLYPLQAGPDGLRQTIDYIITDAAWHCVTRSLFRRWAAAGGKAYLGTFTRGLPYLFNANNDYCVLPGVVCHGDDLYPTFSTLANPSPENATFQDDIRAYWTSFIKTGSPSTAAHPWPQWGANSTDADVNNLGKGRDVPVCPVDFWGTKVPFEFQLFSSNDTGILAAPGNGTAGAGKSPGRGARGAAVALGAVVVAAAGLLVV
ncbi:hypothetical protein Q8F55_007408 [Vanrija albida]|uniref:Carboxylesterase type B domain-containing protein n=1 Tax=Vanrija albida TaxID=181172 RepID=A0ABR3PUF3_9TREE